MPTCDTVVQASPAFSYTASIRVVTNRERDDPATWGQQFMWEVADRLDGGGAQLAISVDVDVPHGTAPRRVERSIQTLCARHDALRTHFHGQTLGAIRQHVRPTVEVPVTEVAVDGENELKDALTRLTRTLRDPGFDPQGHSLVRVGVVVMRGAPRAVVLALSHLVVDGWSLRHLGQELGILLGGGTLAGSPHQPHEQVAFELSAEGSELNRQSLEHQHAVFRSLVPQPSWQDRYPRAAPRFREGVLTSPQAYEVAGATARSARVAVSTVVLAAVVQVLAELTDNHKVTMLMWTHNRLRPRSRDTVGQYTQVVPIEFHTGQLEPRPLLREVQRAVAGGMGRGMYSPAGAARIRSRFEEPPSSKLPLGFRFNHVQADPGDAVSSTLPAQGTFSWRMSADEEDVVASFTMLEAEKALALYADTTFIPVGEIEGTLRRCGALLEDMRRAVCADDGR